MKQTKTFWSVVYNGIGFDRPATAWFDNKEDAVKFASEDYRDNPVKHTVSKPDTIAEYEERVHMTQLGFKGGF